ncbi:aldo/keto reductase [Nonomuraea zeae]|uniref:Oxidoreductase n=1 Tax=Nonomuraea zeae TaxID=1642303 RepID=A0A5S4G5A1_9ACTN|nr:aldo/keto reductase [Nonomuraea zeae]TMR28173.1 oxidoreductase [Nonomuraea zeae]
MSISLPSTGTLTIGGKTVHRLGFGAMSITGPGVWGPPSDHDGALRLLRRVVELGVNLIDTADSYGPYVSEELIREALHPYPEGLLIATKVGFVRTGPSQWHAVGRPEYLRQEVEMSLRRLGLDRIDLLQLHRIDPQVPLEDQLGELKALRDEGKIAAVGLSEVSVDELERARRVVEIAGVQNRYNLSNRSSEGVLEHCAEQGIAFIPYSPIAKGSLAAPGSPVEHVAKAVGATPAQVSLAWLLAHSPVMAPIPGTSSIAHLEENLGASTVSLTAEQLAELG